MKTLLDIDYVTRNDKVIIRLFYKKKDGREIEEVTDFKPYFYAVPVDTEKLKGELKKFDRILKIEKKRMVDMKKEIDVLKITVKQPKDVSELRDKIKNLEYCKEVREAAIPFVERYLIDSGLIPMENSEEVGLRIAAFDMEVYNPRGEPNPERDPIIMISYADNLGLKRVWSYKHENIKLDFLEILKDESMIIKKFIDTVNEQKIDIITSYNGDNFDFPYLKDRASRLKINLSLGIDGSVIKLERRGMNLGARVRGRPHIDMYPICRQVFNLSRYQLEDI
ncbi:MAG TPA: DNA polymerase, partial [Candidatus Altiarchaeales archaeon]|nr:DNA polymerase [Candidatus Altiarchaeales archaeon]